MVILWIVVVCGLLISLSVLAAGHRDRKLWNKGVCASNGEKWVIGQFIPHKGWWLRAGDAQAFIPWIRIPKNAREQMGW